jgi:hypothetical protein|tara:strand:+ start:383 stop:925 length:543 start_codon:yes stop_codon:yes gene_type:complete
MAVEKKVIAKYFPLRALTGALIITIILFIFVGSIVWHLYTNFELTQTRDFKLQELSSTIIYLDEVLTMSARMGAITGDLVWAKRYDYYEPQLSDVITQVKQLSPETFLTEAAIKTEQANIKLVEAERKAFAFIREKNLAAAIALLFSEEYELEKTNYSDGIKKVIGRLQDRIKFTLAKDL